MNDNVWIEFDIAKVKSLKESYTNNLTFLLEQLPKQCNWNSSAQIMAYLAKHFAISLDNVRISTVSRLLDGLDHDSILM